MPLHTHAIAPPISTAAATASSPANAYPAVDVTVLADRATATTKSYGAALTAGQSLANYQSGLAGGNVPISIEPPFLAVYFIISLQGVFPSRS